MNTTNITATRMISRSSDRTRIGIATRRYAMRIRIIPTCIIATVTARRYVVAVDIPGAERAMMHCRDRRIA